MRNVSCRRAREDLPLYCGGELRWWRRALVRLHLRSCAACRRELLELARSRSIFVEAIEQRGVAEPDAELWEGIRRRLARSDRPRPVVLAAPPRLPRLVRVAAPVAGLAAMLLVVFYPRDEEPPGVPVPLPRSGATTPTIECVTPPGATVMSFQTGDPRVAISWIFSPETSER